MCYKFYTDKSGEFVLNSKVPVIIKFDGDYHPHQQRYAVQQRVPNCFLRHVFLEVLDVIILFNQNFTDAFVDLANLVRIEVPEFSLALIPSFVDRQRELLVPSHLVIIAHYPAN